MSFLSDTMSDLFGSAGSEQGEEENEREEKEKKKDSESSSSSSLDDILNEVFPSSESPQSVSAPESIVSFSSSCDILAQEAIGLGSISIKRLQRKKKQKSITTSFRAGLVFPVGRTNRFLKKRRDYYTRVGKTAPVYLAAVLEYLSAEILTLAGEIAKSNHKVRITPRHINIAIRSDSEFDRLLQCATIGHGGGHIAQVLPEHLPSTSRKPQKKKKKNGDSPVFQTVAESSSVVILNTDLNENHEEKDEPVGSI